MLTHGWWSQGASPKLQCRGGSRQAKHYISSLRPPSLAQFPTPSIPPLNSSPILLCSIWNSAESEKEGSSGVDEQGSGSGWRERSRVIQLGGRGRGRGRIWTFWRIKRERIIRRGGELAAEGHGMIVRREARGTMQEVSAVPAAPEAPMLVSASATSMTVEWQEPNNSGSPVTDYTSEHDDGESGPFTRAYTGEKRHYTIEGLKTEHVYRVRVIAHNQKGKGPFSVPAELLTGFAAPSPPPTPSFTRHSTTCVVITWRTPERENGSPVTSFEVETKQPTALGWTLICYGIRAVNLMGKSGWSGEELSVLKTRSAPSPAPEPLVVVGKSSRSISEVAFTIM